MAQPHHLLCLSHILVLTGLHQVPETVQEPGNSLDSPFIPLRIQLRRPDKKLIHPQRITAVIPDQIIRRNHISLGLAHLNAVLSGDHALVKQLGKRLVKINRTDITEELGVEPGVQKMQHCMLHTADIHVHRQVLIRLFPGNQLLVIVAVHIAEEIPGGTGPLRHGVGLSLGRTAALGTGAVHPLVNGSQRRFSGACRLVALHLRKP